jgi:prephenate dehydrogenase
MADTWSNQDTILQRIERLEEELDELKKLVEKLEGSD